MDQKYIKQCLKEAKEAIKNNKYNEAIKLCKNVLKEDRNNYMGLILFGAALQETDLKAEAINAFKKAIEINPEQTLGWQGLVSYYEKCNDNSEEDKQQLIKAYEKLIKLEIDSNKVTDLTNKLANLAKQLKLLDVEIDALLSQENVCKDNLDALQDVRCRIVSALSSNQDELSNKHKLLLEDTLPKIINDKNSVENMENLRRYIGVLYVNKNLTELLKWNKKTREIFPNSIFSLNHVCIAYVENIDTCVVDTAFPETFEILIEMDKDSQLGLLAQGVYFYKKNKFIEARDVLIRAMESNTLTYWLWYWLSRCHIRLYTANEAIKCLKIGMKLVPTDSSYYMLLNKLHIYACSLSEYKEYHKTTAEHAHQYMKAEADELMLESLVNAYIKLGDYKRATLTIAHLVDINPEHIIYHGLKLASEGSNAEATTFLESVQDNKDIFNYARVLLLLGENEWKNNNHKLAFSWFLKAANKDPLYYLPFIRIADYYRKYANDLEKARKCYQKAVRLNPYNEATCLRLSDMYLSTNSMDENFDLLKSVEKSGGKWVSLRLGLVYLQMSKFDLAINQFLTNLRSDPDNSLCWQSLGDAYFMRGSCAPAIDSFRKSLEIQPYAIYPAIQIAKIKLLIGQYNEAIKSFIYVLKKDDEYIPALQGLGEAYYYQAKDFSSRQLTGSARDNCELAINTFTKVLKLNRELKCVWKLMGDTCILASDLGQRSFMNVSSNLIDTKSTVETLIKIDRNEILSLASRCYYTNVKLEEENSCSWSDLALCLKLQAKYIEDISLKKEYLNKALMAAHKSLSINDKSNVWNLLGIIAIDENLRKYKLGQSAFIRAINNNTEDVKSWTNLGSLYMMLGDIELAHKAFESAQRVDPTYVESWIGLALIAEFMGHHDTMDLFRHSTQLSTHREGSIGFANWVAKSMNDLKSDQYIVSAVDEVTWYLERSNEDSCALTLLGIFLERIGLFTGAMKAFEIALNITIKNNDEKLANLARVNLARVLVALNKNLDAIQLLKSVTESNFNSQSVLSLAYYKAEKYQDSYTSYESSSHWLAENDEQKAQILVAMAAMAYKFQGVDGAKSLLFKCAHLKGISVQCLFATCAIGMLHNDLQLTKLALKELQPFVDDPRYLNDIAIFQAYTTFLQRQWKESIKGLCKVIHRHPDNGSLWMTLAILILNMHPNAPVKENLSGHCAGAALVIGKTNKDMSNSKVHSLIALSFLQSNNAKKSLIEAQKAVHINPDNVDNWAVLIAVLVSRCLENNDKKEGKWLALIISLIRRNSEMSKSKALSQWFSNNERKLQLFLEQ